MRAMAAGQIARVEELTRIPADVQDALITILSREDAADPGAGRRRCRRPQGFNVIATANNRDRGRQRAVAPCAAGSTRSCCRCRTAPTRRSRSSRAASTQLGRALELPAEPPALDEIRRVVTVFRELRDGVTAGRPDQAQVARAARCPPPRRSRW